MFDLNLRENLTVVNISELVKNIGAVKKKLKKNKVLVTNRNKAEFILINFEDFQRLMELEEYLEDQILGEEAARQEKEAKPEDYLTLEEVKERLSRLD